ncbi:MAG: response regulator [Spirochaetia bacterium]|jgi:CheY-like chemotaxis protein|nr:response regulator [Spirochaetia bacterium]
MNNKKTILLVDDEISILNSLTRQLRKSGYTILKALGAEEAMRLLESCTVSVIVSDERMPVMGGADFFHKIKTMYPDTIRIILSGYADSQVIINAINKGEVYRYITKPWNAEEVRSIISDAVNQYEILHKNRQYMESILENNDLLQKPNSSRNIFLQITSNILNDLSIPAMVVDKDGIITIANKQLSDLDTGFKEGALLENLFSVNTRDKIMEGYNSPTGQTGFEIDYMEGKLRLLIRSLRSSDPHRGLIIVDEIKK